MRSTANVHTSSARSSHRVLVCEVVSERLDTRSRRCLDPLTPRALERRVSEKRSCPLVLATQTKRLVPSAEGRSERGVVRVELQERRDIPLEALRWVGSERLVVDREELDDLCIRRDSRGREEGP